MAELQRVQGAAGGHNFFRGHNISSALGASTPNFAQDKALRGRSCGVNLLVPRKPLQSASLLCASYQPIHLHSCLPSCRPSSVTPLAMSVIRERRLSLTVAIKVLDFVVTDQSWLDFQIIFDKEL